MIGTGTPTNTLSDTDVERLLAESLDSMPLDGKRPATSWQPGEILTETYRLDLTSLPLKRGLHYYFGYYDWRNGKRLPVDGGLDDKLVFHGR